MSGISSFLIFLPSSKNLNYYWNMGSLLGMFFVIQLLTGLVLVFYYDPGDGFASVQYIMYDVGCGWLMRLLHFNGASFFFFFLYLHMFKGVFMLSFRLAKVWVVGVVMILLFMGVGFMGYVLVFSQMSYWAAVVITSIFTVFPVVGDMLVEFIWGGFSVTLLTVKFFFVLHFVLPWVGAVGVVLHLIYLHEVGSSSVLCCHGDYDKIMFFPYYWLKDIVNVLLLVLFFIWLMFNPFSLGEPEMFMDVDILSSPAHIAPEWYFLYAYSLLRSSDSKMLGVVMLIMSVMILMVLIFNSSLVFLNFSYIFNFMFVFGVVILTWLGGFSPEFPFDFLGGCFSFFFFFFFFLIFIMENFKFYLFFFIFFFFLVLCFLLFWGGFRRCSFFFFWLVFFGFFFFFFFFLIFIFEEVKIYLFV